MWLFIEIVGFFAAVIFAVMGIVTKFKKKAALPKRYFLIALIGLFLFIIGAVNVGSDNVSTEVAKESAPPVSAAPTVQPTASPSPTPPPATEKPKAEPSDEEWQKSYKKIALGEAASYIQTKVKGTLTNDLIKSRSGVIKQQANKLTSDKEKFEDLAAAVSADDTESVKKIYTELGGEDFPELHKEAKPLVAKEEPSKENPSTITKAEYDKIENGMSYKQVQKIIGGPGEILSEGGEKGTEFYTIMVVYYGEGSIGANANFMFQGNKLINKAQLGLK